MALISGEEKDPLTGHPVMHAEPSLEAEDELILFEGMRSLPRYAQRREPFGPVLIQGVQVVLVPPRHTSVLSALEEQITLKQIAERFGPQDLAFVGELYKRGMIDLQV